MTLLAALLAASTAPAVVSDFSRPSTAPVTLPVVLARFEEFDRSIKTLTADFSQSLEMTESGMSSRVAGTLAYAKPDRIRIEHHSPERQTITADGSDIWIYRHARSQAVQAKLADWKEADPTLNNLMRFGSYAKTLEAYKVSLSTSSGPGGAEPRRAGLHGGYEDARPVLTLVPKEGGTMFKLDLVLSPSTLFPETTELTVSGLRVKTAMSGIVFNPEIPDSEFDFTPPPEADVFRGFKPPRLGP